MSRRERLSINSGLGTIREDDTLLYYSIRNIVCNF